MANTTTAARTRVRRQPVLAVLVGLLLASLTPLLVAGPSSASEEDTPPSSVDAPTPAAGSPWFGGDLDWENDDASRYTQRLGSSVSLLARSVDYPLTPEALEEMGDLAARARDQSAVAVLTLLPTDGLEDLTEADAIELTETLNALYREFGSSVLVSFAPEMNGSWTTYGQQPTAYVDAFQALAEVIHDRAPLVRTVWSPAYGGGYPFGGSITDPVRGAVVGERLSEIDRAVLDTNSDLSLDALDDPYGPYFPGEEAVDWVGLSMLRYGDGVTPGSNSVPAPTELKERLDDVYEYPADLNRPSFYERYAVAREKPMLLLTGAAYSAEQSESGGPTERAVKNAWLRRVLAAIRARPEIGGVLWLEVTREEPDLDSTARWGLTSSPALGRALGRALQTGDFDLGPVPATDTDSAAEPGAATDGDEDETEAGGSDTALESAASAIGLSLVQLALVLLIALVVVSLIALRRVRRQRMRPPWE